MLHGILGPRKRSGQNFYSDQRSDHEVSDEGFPTADCFSHRPADDCCFGVALVLFVAPQRRSARLRRCDHAFSKYAEDA